MTPLHVRVKALDRTHVAVFTPVGNHGLIVISLVFIKMNNQFESVSAIVMIQSQNQVSFKINRIFFEKSILFQKKNAISPNKSKCKSAQFHSARNVQTLKHHVQASMKNVLTLMKQRHASVKSHSYETNSEIVTNATHLDHFHGNVPLVSILYSLIQISQLVISIPYRLYGLWYTQGRYNYF